MQIVINIPDYDYSQIKEYYEKNDTVEATYSYIYHGTPLPKGHGRLIDADNVIPLALKEKTLVLKDTNLIAISSREFVIDYLLRDVRDYINNMPTIIEADEKESR